MPITNVSGTSGLVDGSQSAQSADKLEEDLNQFMNLLVTQLQNQDPLDPMDANEFTSQLVQFASVEQQIYQNSNLEDLVGLTQTSQIATMVDYIGNGVEVFGKAINFEGAGNPARFSYTLDGNATDNTITISDSSGVTVYTTEGEVDIGRHDFTWDGRDKYGQVVDPGVYTVTVTAMDGEGKLMDVGQTVFGRVTGASAENGEVSIWMGDIRAPLEQVLAVEEAQTPANDNNQ